MSAIVLTPAPLFELKGTAARIDLSAWISGMSYAAGLALAMERKFSKDQILHVVCKLVWLAAVFL